MKRLVIDYWEFNKQLAKVQPIQVKAKGTITLIEMAKNDHIWAKLDGAWYFSSLDIRAGCHHISIHPDSRPKTAFICTWKIPMEACHLWYYSYTQHIPECYVPAILWISWWFSYFSCREQDGQWTFGTLEKVFKKFRYAGMKLKPSKCNFFKLHIEYLGHLISGTGIPPLNKRYKLFWT